MSEKISIVRITENNLSAQPQAICFINPKNPSFSLKETWIRERLHDGLVIKLLYREGEKRPAGFIEYIPGKKCWRGVNAPDDLFIHCLWISGTKDRNQGLGAAMINECISDAREGGFSGVSVMTSSDAFMAGSGVFKKNGFVCAAADPPFELLTVRFNDTPLPTFTEWRSALQGYPGLHIVYSRQCPWVARFVNEIRGKVEQLGISLSITELKTPEEAQSAPSPYSVFNLIYNGELLASHYISETRFMNILKKIIRPDGF